MKKYFILLSVFLLSLTSCEDFLTVSSDSKYGEEFVYNSKEEMNRALTSVYAAILSGSTYGNSYMTTYAFNNDVEFTSYSNSIKSVNGEDFKCFDGTRFGSSIYGTWTAAYVAIERANRFIEGAENSSIYSADDEDIMQMIGEAKVLRAMSYYDMVVLFGDIPFSFEASTLENLNVPVEDRNVILTTLINDLKGCAKYMKYASQLTEGVERASREFNYALISRIALARGGYSLMPDKTDPSKIGTMQRPADYLDYYEIAKNYADSVILSNTHKLTKEFKDVFIDECNYIVNNGDDPIFEIPFLKMSSGNVGYIHGPSGSTAEGVSTGINKWGGSNGGLRLNAFYRYSFDRSDLRLNYTVGMWYYDAAGTPVIRTDYTTHCNKWSKFWATPANALGVSSSGNTGINYPYMRYADVLLMYAEAVNELENGVAGANGAKAINALRQVRNRAFLAADRVDKVETYLTTASASKDAFFKAIADERKWEFGGENMRWKDLVRWNLYSKVAYDVFTDYYVCGNYNKGNFLPGYEKFDKLPTQMFYKIVANPGSTSIYPNTVLPILDIYNLYVTATNPGADYKVATFYEWRGSDDSEYPAAQCTYSMRGFVRMGTDNDNYETMDVNNLPPVRYILPVPAKVVQLSNGLYKNYYGYN